MKHIFPTFKDALIVEITDDDIAEWQVKLKSFVMPNGKHLSNSGKATVKFISDNAEVDRISDCVKINYISSCVEIDRISGDVIVISSTYIDWKNKKLMQINNNAKFEDKFTNK